MNCKSLGNTWWYNPAPNASGLTSSGKTCFPIACILSTRCLVVNNSLEDKRQSNPLRQGQPPPQSAAVYFVSCQLWQSPSEATVSVVLTLMEIQTVDTSKLRLSSRSCGRDCCSVSKTGSWICGTWAKEELAGHGCHWQKKIWELHTVFFGNKFPDIGL